MPPAGNSAFATSSFGKRSNSAPGTITIKVFGKARTVASGACEERHFETVPSCAYIAVPLLDKLGVEETLSLNGVEHTAAITLVNALLAQDSVRMPRILPSEPRRGFPGYLREDVTNRAIRLISPASPSRSFCCWRCVGVRADREGSVRSAASGNP